MADTVIANLTLKQKPWSGNPAEDRETYIGGSDAGTILGLNPWKSAYTLWCEKTGLIDAPDISEKEAVWWGNYDEEGVAKRFTIKTGFEVQRSNKTYYIEEFPQLVGHIDRKLVGLQEGLECKTTSSWNKSDFESGEIPPMHYAQCQHYMMVTGWSSWWYAVKKDNTNFYVVKIQRDDAYIKEMFEKEIAFWNLCETGDAPEIDSSDSTGETIQRLHPAENADNDEDTGTMQFDLNTEAVLAEVDQIDEQIKQLEEIKDADINRIKAAIGDYTVAYGSKHKVTWKPSKGKISVDNAKLKEKYPKVYEDCKKQGKPCRTFKINSLKDKREEE